MKAPGPLPSCNGPRSIGVRSLKALAKEIYQVCRYYGSYRVYWSKELSEESIKDWLKGGENTVFVYEKKDETKLRLPSLVKKREEMAKADV